MSVRTFRLVEVARLAMQSPLQALALSCIFYISDFTSWLTLAIVSLMLLRNGMHSVAFTCLLLLSIQFLPSVGLQLIDVLVLLSLLAAGQILRVTLRLDIALVVASVVGCLLTGLVQQFANHLLLPFTQAFEELNRLAPEISKTVQEESKTYVLRSVGALVAIKSSLILLLARYWQSELFNPQGFGREFMTLRVSAPITVIWGLALLLLHYAPSPFRGLSSGASTPFFFAGLACCHWVFAYVTIKKTWQVLFYLSLVVSYPMVLLVGVVDSLTDIRDKLLSKASTEKK